MGICRYRAGARHYGFAAVPDDTGDRHAACLTSNLQSVQHQRSEDDDAPAHAPPKRSAGADTIANPAWRALALSKQSA